MSLPFNIILYIYNTKHFSTSIAFNDTVPGTDDFVLCTKNSISDILAQRLQLDLHKLRIIILTSIYYRAYTRKKEMKLSRSSALQGLVYLQPSTMYRDIVMEIIQNYRYVMYFMFVYKII